MTGLYMDMWLSNWDVFGNPPNTNLLFDGVTVYRIDQGGALGFRAMGAKKTPDQFSSVVDELATFKTALSPAHRLYKEFPNEMDEILEEALERIASISETDIRYLVSSVGMDKAEQGALISKLLARREDLIFKHAKEIQTIGSGKKFQSIMKIALASQHALEVLTKAIAKTKKKITTAQHAALQSYQGGSSWLNNTLRALAKDPTIDLTAHQKAQIKHMDEVTLNHVTIDEPIIVYRGNIPQKAIDGIFGKKGAKPEDVHMALGNVYRDPGYSSTSIWKGKADHFGGAGSWVIRIHLPKGQTAAAPYLETKGFESEVELILPRGLRMEVTGAWKDPKTGHNVLNVSVIGDNIGHIPTHQAVKIIQQNVDPVASAADMDPLGAEATYSDRDAFDPKNGDPEFVQRKVETDIETESEILADLVEADPTIADDLKIIDEEISVLQKQAVAEDKGMRSAFRCVLKNMD
jgi:hypothetical protein